LTELYQRAAKACAVCALAGILPGGCASYDPNDYYDPNAVQKAGVIYAKTLAGSEPRPWGDPKAPVFIPIGGVIVPVWIGAGRGESRIDIYEYRVRLPGDESATVYSEYPFEMGECVKVFFSARDTYPRMAYGADCEK
jgi:hypothetical protein